MTISRRDFTRCVVGAGLSGLLPACSTLGDASDAASQLPLKTLAQRQGMHFGNAMGISASGVRGQSRFHDARYRALMERECSALVAENETKWQALCPRPGPYRFQQADEMFAWGKQQGMLLRGHTLIWQPSKWLPNWVNTHDFGSRPALEAERLIGEHVATVCSHFGRDIASYDVVNEAVDPATGELRRNVFTERLGAVEQIDLTFRLARQAAPHAELVYNDYMSWGDGYAKHRAGVLRLLAALRARGTPVHALGLQSHIGSTDEGPSPTPGGTHEREWRQFLDAVTAMDFDLLITELDVHDKDFAADIAARDAAVAGLARSYLDLTLSYPRLHTVMLWGMTDPMSWLQDRYPRADGLPKRPCPWDGDLQPKPLRTALAQAFLAMPTRTLRRAAAT